MGLRNILFGSNITFWIGLGRSSTHFSGIINISAKIGSNGASFSNLT
jgi:hypothetical protein